MANLADFMPFVMPYVKGCSYPLAEQMLRNTCIDFCGFAPIVQVTLDPIDALAGVHEYDLDTPSGTLPTVILDGWFQGNRLGIFKTRDINSHQSQFNTEFAGASRLTGTPTSIQQYATSKFLLDFAPSVDAPKAITLIVATKPTPKATTVDDILLNDYGYEIGLGAVAKLMLIPNEKFSNLSLASTYEQTYLRARADARIAAEASFGQAGSTVRPRRFY